MYLRIQKKTKKKKRWTCSLQLFCFSARYIAVNIYQTIYSLPLAPPPPTHIVSVPSLILFKNNQVMAYIIIEYCVVWHCEYYMCSSVVLAQPILSELVSCSPSAFSNGTYFFRFYVVVLVFQANFCRQMLHHHYFNCWFTGSCDWYWLLSRYNCPQTWVNSWMFGFQLCFLSRHNDRYNSKGNFKQRNSNNLFYLDFCFQIYLLETSKLILITGAGDLEWM